MLTAHEINREIENKRIIIDPFNPEQMNPNSYDLTLQDILYRVGINPSFKYIDPRNPESVELSKVNLDPETGGFIIEPGYLYLGASYEKTETSDYIPMLEGKSSIARNGISVHLSAGFGDIGFTGSWTLEITTMYPAILYPGMRIAQISYIKPDGEVVVSYRETGRYNYQYKPTKAR